MDLRRARDEDYGAIAAFTRDTWPDREGGDYIPDVYHEWIAGDGDGQMTFVIDAGDDVAGVVQAVVLSPWEGWTQGIRVNPAYRERGVATDLTDAACDWLRSRGVTVARHMIFSWNGASLGLSRGAGFDPATEFRWAHPEPDPEADPALAVSDDADAAWRFWTRSDARSHLRGLALDDEESWALSELTRERLRTAAADGRLLALREESVRAVAVRNRTYERGGDDAETWAEYAVGAWTDLAAAGALFDAVARDAAAVGADRTRVLIPERVEWVSDAAAARVELSDEPDFVLERDLS
jgi:GNAT superfamily N-acetyltransferase